MRWCRSRYSCSCADRGGGGVVTAELLHSSLTTAVWVIGGGIALWGVDDLLLDLAAHFRTALRRLTIYSRHRRATCSQLSCPPERPVAILIPAWQESAVIGRMLQHLRSVLAYCRYRVFLGYYPNDPATARAARVIDPDRAWLELVALDSPGPTSKAHCLNGIWDGIRAYERRAGIRFEMFVLHDAEDAVRGAAQAERSARAGGDLADAESIEHARLPRPNLRLVGFDDQGHHAGAFPADLRHGRKSRQHRIGERRHRARFSAGWV